MSKFLGRVHRIAAEVTSAPGADARQGDQNLRRVTHRTVHEVTGLV